MSLPENEQMKRWVSSWQITGRELQRLNDDALQEVDVSLAIESLSDAFESALLHSAKTTSSGLVEQQSLFKRLRS